MSQRILVPSDSVPLEQLTFQKLHSVNNPNSMHGIYPYRGKISAIDARQILSQLMPGKTLLDPFCGSGTILYEAQHLGITPIGIDNNPLAVTLSLAKTQHIDIQSTLEQSREYIRKAKSIENNMKTTASASKYFHEKSLKEILAMLSYIEEMNSYEKAIIYGSIGLTARACNNYVWTSNSVGKVVLPLKYVNFYNVYQKKLEKHIKFVNGGTEARVIQGDARNLVSYVGQDSIDYVYTSPPYFDALDYTSYHAKIIYDLEGKNRGLIRKGLIQKASTYEKDMKLVLGQIKKVVKVSGTVIFVVGDKKLKDGTIINGGEFFMNLSDWKPSYIVEREYSGSSSQIWDKINKTKRKEQIVVWKRD